MSQKVANVQDKYEIIAVQLGGEKKKGRRVKGGRNLRKRKGRRTDACYPALLISHTENYLSSKNGGVIGEGKRKNNSEMVRDRKRFAVPCFVGGAGERRGKDAMSCGAKKKEWVSWLLQGI